MRSYINYKPQPLRFVMYIGSHGMRHTSAPVVDRVAVRLILADSVNEGCELEHFDIASAFLHDNNKFNNPVYIKNGTVKHTI